MPWRSPKAIHCTGGGTTRPRSASPRIMTARAAALHARGFAVLMIDLRKHGESGGDHFTFGAKERWDVLAAVDWLQKRGFKVGVLGVSLGAVSAAGAAADPEGGANIRALVLDSAFADSGETISKSFAQETGLPTQLLPGAFRTPGGSAGWQAASGNRWCDR